MRHPKRSITRPIRTRKPRHPRRATEDLAAVTWPESVRVEDCMTRAVITVGWEAPVGNAWQLMRAAKVRHLPVLDARGRLAGIVTDRDLRQIILDPSLRERVGNDLLAALETLTVRDIMSWAVITVRPETGLREAARIMYEKKIGALPVGKNDEVVGILTESDAVRILGQFRDEGVLSSRYRWALTKP